VYEIFDEWRHWLFNRFGGAARPSAHGVPVVAPVVSAESGVIL
jgi:hypothetical protein